MNAAPQISENISLQPYNGMAVAAKARYFICAESQVHIDYAAKFCQSSNLACMILGEGSNTLFTRDFDGLVLVNRLRGIQLIEENQDSVLVQVAAGENWHEFVQHCLDRGWFGLENLALIPGTVGAAPIQNIGAYGVEVGEFIQSVQFFTWNTHLSQTLTSDECAFAYRDSIFKHRLRNQGVIIAVVFRLLKHAKPRVSYQPLQQYFAGAVKPKAQEVFHYICALRTAKLPDPKHIPNLGSFFKNPIVSSATLQCLQVKYPDIVHFAVEQGHKLAAAWLIENLGWKKKEYKSVRVADTQALVITNPKHATGADIHHYAQQIQAQVQEHYGVELEIEPTVV